MVFRWDGSQLLIDLSNHVWRFICYKSFRYWFCHEHVQISNKTIDQWYHSTTNLVKILIQTNLESEKSYSTTILRVGMTIKLGVKQRYSAISLSIKWHMDLMNQLYWYHYSPLDITCIFFVFVFRWYNLHFLSNRYLKIFQFSWLYHYLPHYCGWIR